MNQAAALEDADRCRDLMRAIVERAQRDARGEGLSVHSGTREGQRAARLEAQEWLRWLRERGS